MQAFGYKNYKRVGIVLQRGRQYVLVCTANYRKAVMYLTAESEIVDVCIVTLICTNLDSDLHYNSYFSQRLLFCLGFARSIHSSGTSIRNLQDGH